MKRQKESRIYTLTKNEHKAYNDYMKGFIKRMKKMVKIESLKEKHDEAHK